MSLIPQEDLKILQAASAVKAVAETAAYEQDLQAVAFAINSAANTGATSVTITMKLSKEVKDELEKNGYKLSNFKYNASPDNQTIVSWEAAE